MIKSKLILAALLLAGCGGSSAPPVTDLLPTPPPGGSLTGRPETAADVSFAGLLNGVRLANGSASVFYDPNLGLAAQDHAADMLAQNYFSHVSLDGRTFTDRATAAGYKWKALGENIAQGQTTQQQVVTAWTNSPGHHANNINPTFEDFGLGRAGSGGNTRWVLVLGRD